MTIDELRTRINSLPKGKKIAVASAGALVVLLAASGIAYALFASAPTSNDVVEKTPLVEEKIVKDFEVNVTGDIGGQSVIASATLSIFDGANKEVETIASSLDKAAVLEGKDYESGKYTIELTESPVLSDGSMLTLQKLVTFELKGTPKNSNDATFTVKVNLTKLEVGEMTEEQLRYSAQKVRDAGNNELADALSELARVFADADGENPLGADLVWREAVTEQVKVVTRKAWTENVFDPTVDVGPLNYYCLCGAGPYENEGGISDHLNAFTQINDEGSYYLLPGHGATYRVADPRKAIKEVYHPEEFYWETRIITPAGWYPR